jgi:hypothetical protein
MHRINWLWLKTCHLSKWIYLHSVRVLYKLLLSKVCYFQSVYLSVLLTRVSYLKHEVCSLFRFMKGKKCLQLWLFYIIMQWTVSKM